MPYLDEKSEHNAMPDEKSDTVSLTNSSRSAAISSVNHEVINGISQTIPYAMANVCIEDDELFADLEVEQVTMQQKATGQTDVDVIEVEPAIVQEFDGQHHTSSDPELDE